MARRIRTCFDCGAQVPTDALICPFCSGTELTVGHARPTRPAIIDSPALPWPWSVTLKAWPAGGLVGLYGAPGSGKSSLAARLRPELWLTSEQLVHQAHASISYAQGADYSGPEIAEVGTPGDVGARLAHQYAGMVVLDSVTRCGNLQAQLQVLELLERWVQDGEERRALAVLQVNEKGEPAGLTENEHLVTAIVGVIQEDSGLRRLFAKKNRAGDLGVAYFTLSAEGLGHPKLPYSYSVEGAHGRYALVPWPTPGARWAGLLDAAFKTTEGDVAAVPGLASAGRPVAGYAGGALYPADVLERRKFAEAHGLTWFGGP